MQYQEKDGVELYNDPRVASMSSLCRSDNLYLQPETGIYQCWKAPFSPTTTQFLPQEIGTICNYTSFIDTDDFNKGVLIQEPAQCGYSYQSVAFCNKHKGDAEYLKLIQNYIDVFNYNTTTGFSNMSVNCNILATKCAEFVNSKNAISNFNRFWD